MKNIKNSILFLAVILAIGLAQAKTGERMRRFIEKAFGICAKAQTVLRLWRLVCQMISRFRLFIYRIKKKSNTKYKSIITQKCSRKILSNVCF